MKMVFDIGMYDGSDTAYYLARGYRVVAVEANPDLVDDAHRIFATQIAAGQLTCVNAAISSRGEAVELNLCGQDAGSSSLFGGRITHRRPIGSITVPGVTLQQLFEQHGVPDYLKVDIEGADRFCVLALTEEARPPFISFEVGDDADELLSHVEAIGFHRFKIINQNSFRELANERCLYDRAAHRLMRYMGYREPLKVRRAGRFFVSDHSSGPVPWDSDGTWHSGQATRARLHAMVAARASSQWYDIHATVG